MLDYKMKPSMKQLLSLVNNFQILSFEYYEIFTEKLNQYFLWSPVSSQNKKDDI